MADHYLRSFKHLNLHKFPYNFRVVSAFQENNGYEDEIRNAGVIDEKTKIKIISFAQCLKLHC